MLVEKRYLFPIKKTGSCLTQFAYGELDPGEIIESQKPPTMEKHFYFIEGI